MQLSESDTSDKEEDGNNDEADPENEEKVILEENLNFTCGICCNSFRAPERGQPRFHLPTIVRGKL